MKYIVTVSANGNRYWRNEDGKLHRLDGPAIEYDDGHTEWWVDGKLHRTDGPAIEHLDGSRVWLVDGKTHRLDGPAVEDLNGYKEWWVNGVKLTKKQFEAHTKSCDGKVVEIDGRKYRLTAV